MKVSLQLQFKAYACLFSAVFTNVRATCEGVMSIEAVSKEINDLNHNHFSKSVGQVSYSLDGAGNLNLTSITPSWHCGPIMNFVSSNVTLPDPSKKHKKKHNEMIVVQSVGAQIHCHSDVSSIDTSWMTLSKEISFYGSLFFQIEMKGENCNKPAELILDYSRCSYNLTMNNSRKSSGIPCDWKFSS